MQYSRRWRALCASLLLCCLCFAGFPAQAATGGRPAQPAPAEAPLPDDAVFLKAELVPPVWSTDSVLVRLRPDEKLCRKAYGEQWEERCFAAPGVDGEPVAGVALRAETPRSETGTALPRGQWRWQGYDTLAFVPESPWQAQTGFRVELGKLPLPSRMRLSNAVLRGSTLPLAAQSDKGQVWIDPSVSGPRAVSFALRFTSPPDKSLERNMVLASADPALQLGAVQVIWSQDGASCVVKAPVPQLSSADAIVTLRVRGLRPLGPQRPGVSAPPLLKGDLEQRVTVPGAQHLFRVQSAQMGLERNGALAQEYRLALKTSLRVPAAELLKALRVVELPAVQNPEATAPYRWTSAPAITQEDLNKGRPLAVELVKDPGESGEPFVLRVPAAAGRYVYCLLPQGFGPRGHTLAAPWAAVFQAVQPRSAVSFLQPGHVLALAPGGDNRLDIMASGVDAVRWRASRLRGDNLNLMQLFTSSYNRFAPGSGMDVASTTVEGVMTLPPAEENVLLPRFLSLSLADLMREGTGLVNVELVGQRKGEEVAWASRLVLATDLGMVAKVQPDGGRQVFVCSLSAGTPAGDVTVRILGANGQPVAEARTDAQGRAALPAVRGLQREKEAVALVALRGGKDARDTQQDMAWMALDDDSRRVDYSRFPTQGQISSPDNINAYVFGQRGIFRPGETLRFGMVLRRGDWKPLPPDMPLVGTLSDPAGRAVMRRTFTVGEGLAEWSWASPESAPSGRYRLDVAMPAASGDGEASGDILGSGAVRVEEFQPDTLAIRAELAAGVAGADGTAGWLVTPTVSPSGTQSADPALTVHVRNFYGLPAEGRKVRAELSVRPATLHFAGFEDYVFPDVLPLGNAAEAATATPLPETLTSAQGEARIPLPLSAYQNRTMACRVLVEGFEADGGRAVATEKSFIVSPLSVMLGYRPTGAVGDLAYVPQGTRGGLELVALGPDLRPASPDSLGSLRLSVAERRYVTVLSTDAQGKYVYEESPVDKEISGTSATVKADGRLEWALPTGAPGEFLLTVRGKDDKVMARIPFTVAGNDDLRPALSEAPSSLPSTQMRLRLDKADYAPGDTVNIFMAAPYDGVGLITLERDRVAAHAWFRASAGHSVHSLTIPRDFEGRGYINVTMGRALSSPEIFMQPHSFAVVPLTVNVAARDMGLHFQTPQQVLPGTALTARLTSRHAGKALVFAVDEGVLQLTRFATPDPLRYLLLDRALEVRTDQLFDLLMPTHGQLARRLPAFGGDMMLGGGRFANPFKRRSEPPLAWWSGMVDVGPQGTDISIPVPAYTNGEVRLMAVAVSGTATGNAEARTVARAPLVMTSQMPLMAAPGDEFEGGMLLHNTTDKPLDLALSIESKGLTLHNPQCAKDALPATLSVPAGKEVFVPLRCTATEGAAELTMIALTESGQTFRRSATLSVRPPVLPRTETRMGFAPDGALPPLDLTRALHPYKADATLSVSAAPLPPLRALLRSLAAYPYDCVEQSISRALPLALLQRRPGMDAVLTPPAINGKPRAEAHALMRERALSAISAAFRHGAGVAPWPDAAATDLLLTAYAGDYLLSLREAGLSLPGELSTAFFRTLQDMADRAPDSLGMARAQAYGLWVLTRSGVITSQWLDNLRQQLDGRWPGWNRDVLASFMAGSYAVMNMNAQARQLLDAGAEGGFEDDGSGGAMNALAARALHVAVLARHFPQRLHGNAGKLAARLLEDMNASGGYATFASAQGARALLDLAAPLGQAATQEPQRAGSGLAQAALRCVEYQPGFGADANGAAQAGQATEQVAGQSPLPALLSLSAPGCTRFSLSLPEKMPLYWEASTDGYDRQPPASAENNGMEVARTLLLPDGSPLGAQATVVQGTVLRVELSARVYGKEGPQATPVVLANLLPGGFELVLSHPHDTLPRPTEQEGDAQAGGYTRLDRREDRVLAHVSAGNEPAVFVYHVRAVNRGRYVLPAAYGEGLYDRSVNSHTAAGIITVQ